MPYVQQSWSDGASGGTPVTAARLGYMEAGIATATGSSSLTASVVGNEVDLTLTSNWGIDSGGNPYYDPAGVAAADAAIATLGADGYLVLTDTRGGVVPVAVTSVNGHTGATVVLVKADVGLGSVDNTPDSAKPVSAAQAAYATSRAVAMALVLGS